MPVKKYKLVDIVKDGIKRKGYYSYDTDSYLEQDIDSSDETIFYDEDENKILKGKELNDFLKNNPDFLYDDEIDEDLEIDNEIEKEFDVNVMYENTSKFHEIENEKERIINKYSKYFESKSICDISNLSYGMKLNSSVRYQDQKVDQSMFNKAVEYTYHEERHGHSKNLYDITYVGIGKLFEEMLLRIGYHLYFKNDEDLTFKNKEDNKLLKDQRYDEFYENVESSADELNLTGDEREEYINHEMEQYEKRYSFLIYNNQMEKGYLSTGDMERRVTVDEKASLLNPKDEEPLIEASKLSIIAGLLGYGDPRLAFTQFLDPVALKNNEYKFNDKAIDDFIKDIKITSKDKENMVYNAYDHAAFTEMFKEAITESNVKKISYYEAVNYGKSLVPNYKEKNHSDKYYADLGLEAKKEEAYINKNNKVLKVAKLYNDAKLVRSTKPWYYIIAHPMKAYMEYQNKKNMLNYINKNLIKGTDFHKRVQDYIDCKVKDIDKCYSFALDKVNEPKENNLYFKTEIEYSSLAASEYSDYEDAKYTDEEMKKMGMNTSKDIEKVQDGIKTLLKISELDNDTIVNNKEELKDNDNIQVSKDSLEI